MQIDIEAGTFRRIIEPVRRVGATVQLAQERIGTLKNTAWAKTVVVYEAWNLNLQDPERLFEVRQRVERNLGAGRLMKIAEHRIKCSQCNRINTAISLLDKETDDYTIGSILLFLEAFRHTETQSSN